MTSRRQFLGAAAAVVSLPAAAGDTEPKVLDTEAESLKGSVEWQAAGVFEDHLIPARIALTSSEGVDIEAAKEELREGLKKLEEMESTDASR